MRYLFSTILLTLFSLSISAQMFNVNGTILYDNGNPVNYEYLEFYAVNLAGDVIINTNAFSDVNGFYTKDLDVSQADSQNAIEVRMRDCDSTWVTQIVYVFPGATEATADFTYCQNQIVCETVIEILDQSGAPLPVLYAENTAGAGPFTYLWSTGETTGSISATESGVYCVTTTDVNGCEASNCITVTLNPPLDSCDVFIITNENPAGGLTLDAQWITNDIAAVVWNTGETTTSINVTAEGTYCVEATFGSGCVATACYEYVSNSADSCWVTITEEIGSGGIEYVVANPIGIAPFTFLWNDGSTFGSVLSAPNENFCVTVTDAVGCTSEACYFVASNSTIQGNVWTDSLPGINTGIVYLIQFDPIDSTLTLIDSTAFSSDNSTGYYSFDGANLQPGNYLVKAALDANSFGYSNHLPTYGYDRLFWYEANEITVPANSIQYTNIAMVLGNNPGGPGFIGGYVTEGANKPNNTDTDVKGPGDPMANVSILLLDINDNPITHTVTNEEGRYEFDDLPYGTYKVYVEIWGKQPGMRIVTIDGNAPAIDYIDFSVNSTYTTTSIVEIEQVKSIKLFPNPVTNSSTLNLALDMITAQQLTIEIVSVNGKRLSTTAENVAAGVNIIPLDINQLNTGVYFLNVKSSNGVMTRKFVR